MENSQKKSDMQIRTTEFVGGAITQHHQIQL